MEYTLQKNQMDLEENGNPGNAYQNLKSQNENHNEGEITDEQRALAKKAVKRVKQRLGISRNNQSQRYHKKSYIKEEITEEQLAKAREAVKRAKRRLGISQDNESDGYQDR